MEYLCPPRPPSDDDTGAGQNEGLQSIPSPDRSRHRRRAAGGIIHGESSDLAGEIQISGSDTVLPHSSTPAVEFYWKNDRARLPLAEFQHIATAGSIVLLAMLLSMNAMAILIRNRYVTG